MAREKFLRLGLWSLKLEPKGEFSANCYKTLGIPGYRRDVD